MAVQNVSQHALLKAFKLVSADDQFELKHVQHVELQHVEFGHVQAAHLGKVRVVVQHVVHHLGGQQRGGQQQTMHAERVDAQVERAFLSDFMQVVKGDDENGARAECVAR